MQPLYRYYVVPVAQTGHWTVLGQGHVTRRYANQTQALIAARAAAWQLFRLGLSSQVSVLVPDGRFFAEWRFTQDVPPRFG